MDAIRAIFVFEGKEYDTVSLTASGLQVGCVEGFPEETLRRLRGGGFTFILRDAVTGNEAELAGELAKVERELGPAGVNEGGRAVNISINYIDNRKAANGRDERASGWPLILGRDGVSVDRHISAVSEDFSRGGTGRTIAVGGGKGGVGKTIIAVNLSFALSLLGKSVTLLDGDIGNCNCNTLLGITRIENSIEDYLRGSKTLEEITVSTAYSGLRLVCGAQNKVDTLLSAGLPRLIDDIRNIDGDALVVDLGAGMSDETLSLYRMAGEKLIVVTPQVTSLQNAYGFVKSAFFHDLKCTGGFDSILVDVRSDPQMLYSLIENLKDGDERRHLFAAVLERQRFRIIGSMMNDENDMRIIQNLQKVVGQYLHIGNTILGTIASSGDIRNSVNRITPFLALYPHLPQSLDMKRMASRILQKVP